MFAFLHREYLGIADGMGDLSDPSFNVTSFSPGTREDNYIFNSDILLNLYNRLETLQHVKIPLPRNIQKILNLPMSYCYFDKAPLQGIGSICFPCAQELRKEGYDIPDDIIA